MATFAEAIEFLKKSEGGEALVEAVTAETQKKNREAESLRNEKKRLEAKISVLKESGINTDAEDLTEEISRIKNAGGKTDEVAARIKALENKLAQSEKEKADEKSQRETLLKRNGLGKLLSDVIDPDDYTEILLPKVKIGTDGALLFGDDQKPLEEGVAEWKKGKAHIIKNVQNPGGGTGNNGGNAATQKQPSMDEIVKNPIAAMDAARKK